MSPVRAGASPEGVLDVFVDNFRIHQECVFDGDHLSKLWSH